MKNVLVVGTGTIGEPLIGLLAQHKEALGIDNVYFFKRTPLSDEKGKVEALIRKGSKLVSTSDALDEFKNLGFEPENLPKIFNKNELTVTSWGTLKINFSTMMTNIEGVFAAGDIVRGASLVVWGIKDGREAAQNIDLYLKDKNIFKRKHSNGNNYEKNQ